MKHVIFALFVILYVLVFGQAWTSYAAALMISVWVRHDHGPT